MDHGTLSMGQYGGLKSQKTRSTQKERGFRVWLICVIWMQGYNFWVWNSLEWQCDIAAWLKFLSVLKIGWILIKKHMVQSCGFFKPFLCLWKKEAVCSAEFPQGFVYQCAFRFALQRDVVGIWDFLHLVAHWNTSKSLKALKDFHWDI